MFTGQTESNPHCREKFNRELMVSGEIQIKTTCLAIFPLSPFYVFVLKTVFITVNIDF